MRLASRHGHAWSNVGLVHGEKSDSQRKARQLRTSDKGDLALEDILLEDGVSRDGDGHCRVNSVLERKGVRRVEDGQEGGKEE